MVEPNQLMTVLTSMTSSRTCPFDRVDLQQLQVCVSGFQDYTLRKELMAVNITPGWLVVLPSWLLFLPAQGSGSDAVNAIEARRSVADNDDVGVEIVGQDGIPHTCLVLSHLEEQCRPEQPYPCTSQDNKKST